jgi:hypothetical protein
LGAQLGVTRRTMARWQAWWREQFPRTPLWRAACARFMPPLQTQCLPGGLLERFSAVADEALVHESVMRLLVWLSPVTVRDGGPSSIELHEGR